MTLSTRVSVLALLLLLTGCATTPLSNSLLESPPPDLEAATRLTHVPFFPQDQYQCGPAALATILAATNIPVVPDDLVSKVYVPGKQGSYQLELVTASRSFERLAYLLDPSLENLLQEISAGNPVLVLQNLGLKIAPQWHFAVVTGYDLTNSELILNSGTIEHYTMPLKVFERTWARGNYWSLVVTPPGELPQTARPRKVFDALSALEFNRTSMPVLAAYYDTAVMHWPEDSNLLMGYGNLRYAMGDALVAADLYSRVIQVDPAYAPAHNNLANVLYELGENDSALEHARQAVNLGGEFSAAYAETYAMIAGDTP